MNQKTFTVLSVMFSVLVGCGGGQSLVPNSQNIFTPSENNTQPDNSPTGTWNLEPGTLNDFVKAIDSPNYKGEIALTLKFFGSM